MPDDEKKPEPRTNPATPPPQDDLSRYEFLAKIPEQQHKILGQMGYTNPRPAPKELDDIYQDVAKRTLALAKQEDRAAPFGEGRLIAADNNFPRVSTLDPGVTIISQKMIDEMLMKDGRLDTLAAKGFFAHELAGHSLNLDSDIEIHRLDVAVHSMGHHLLRQTSSLGDGLHEFVQTNLMMPFSTKKTSVPPSKPDSAPPHTLAKIKESVAAIARDLSFAGVAVVKYGPTLQSVKDTSLQYFIEDRADEMSVRVMGDKTPIIKALEKQQEWFAANPHYKPGPGKRSMADRIERIKKLELKPLASAANMALPAAAPATPAAANAEPALQR